MAVHNDVFGDQSYVKTGALPSLTYSRDQGRLTRPGTDLKAIALKKQMGLTPTAKEIDRLARRLSVEERHGLTTLGPGPDGEPGTGDERYDPRSVLSLAFQGPNYEASRTETAYRNLLNKELQDQSHTFRSHQNEIDRRFRDKQTEAKRAFTVNRDDARLNNALTRNEAEKERQLNYLREQSKQQAIHKEQQRKILAEQASAFKQVYDVIQGDIDQMTDVVLREASAVDPTSRRFLQGSFARNNPQLAQIVSDVASRINPEEKPNEFQKEIKNAIYSIHPERLTFETSEDALKELSQFLPPKLDKNLTLLSSKTKTRAERDADAAAALEALQ